jgi:hypothetical protein
MNKNIIYPYLFSSVGILIGCSILNPLTASLTGLSYILLSSTYLMFMVKTTTIITTSKIGYYIGDYINIWINYNNSKFKYLSMKEIGLNESLDIYLKDKYFSNYLLYNNNLNIKYIYFYIKNKIILDNNEISFIYNKMLIYFNKNTINNKNVIDFINGFFYKINNYYLNKIKNKKFDIELSDLKLNIKMIDKKQNILNILDIQDKINFTLYIISEKIILDDIYNKLLIYLKKKYKNENIHFINKKKKLYQINNLYLKENLNKETISCINNLWKCFFVSNNIFDKYVYLYKIQIIISNFYKDKYFKSIPADNLLPLFISSFVCYNQDDILIIYYFLEEFSNTYIYNGIFDYLLLQLNMAIQFIKKYKIIKKIKNE